MENSKIYTSIVNNSIQGKSENAKPYRFFKVNAERFKKSVVGLCCTCTVFGAITATGAQAIGKKISDNIEVLDTINQFKNDVVASNTHRTEDDQNYWYDYEEIAKNIKTDEDIYLLYRSLGEEQSNKVLEYVDGKPTIQGHISKNNYKDISDWSKTSNKQILLQKEIVSKQRELDAMQPTYEEPDLTASNDLGGK